MGEADCSGELAACIRPRIRVHWGYHLDGWVFYLDVVHTAKAVESETLFNKLSVSAKRRIMCCCADMRSSRSKD